ncbi:MAG: hypothetical protein ACREML_03220 [Vulcanimicrobiaceae bacterium]
MSDHAAYIIKRADGAFYGGRFGRPEWHGELHNADLLPLSVALRLIECRFPELFGACECSVVQMTMGEAFDAYEARRLDECKVVA